MLCLLAGLAIYILYSIAKQICVLIFKQIAAIWTPPGGTISIDPLRIHHKTMIKLCILRRHAHAHVYILIGCNKGYEE